MLHPIYVDLDGTLISSDTLWENLVVGFKKDPLKTLRSVLSIFRGKGAFKSQIAKCAEIDVGLLPYNSDLLNWLHEQKNKKRKIYLATAATKSIADAVATHLKLFDGVLASSPNSNLRGHTKADAILAHANNGPFTYVGDSTIDLAVWKQATTAVVVSSSKSLVEQIRKISELEKIFPIDRINSKVFAKQLRVHQWAKNILLMVPMIAAHAVSSANFLSVFHGILAFSLCASCVYLLNDLADLEDDRRHKSKKFRPLASGTLNIPSALSLLASLGASALLISASLPSDFKLVLLIYFATTLAYSFYLKRLAIIDVLILGLLYSLRVIAGGAILGLAYSPWLLSFSFFLFLSLAFAKRYVEVINAQSGMKLPGRGYMYSDHSFILGSGLASAGISALVVTMYLQSPESLALYNFPHLLIANMVILLYWILRVWLKAVRGQLHDDPVVFAIKDPASLLAGCLFLLTGLVAR